MSNIAKAFEHGKAFIPFITCGDPDLETTGQVVRAAVENGADLVELGIPFSDPTAEGPVIQEANIRALNAGVTTDKIFDLVRDLRKDVKIPMVFMTYANVVFSYGSEKFIRTCSHIGIDGITRRHRSPKRNHNGHPSYDRSDPCQHERSVRSWLWNLHTGAGRKNGSRIGRSHRRICHHKAAGNVQKRRGCVRGRIRKKHEGRLPESGRIGFMTGQTLQNVRQQAFRKSFHVRGRIFFFVVR